MVIFVDSFVLRPKETEKSQLLLSITSMFFCLLVKFGMSVL